MERPKLKITPQQLKLITEIDTFRGQWSATHTLAPERLASLKQIATIESVGSSTRIEGVKLTNQEIDDLLRGIKTYSFRSRDEQEVGGYAELMELIYHSHPEIQFTVNYIKQLHGVLLKYSSKDERHRGDYKKFPNNVEAFGSDGKSRGIIFETTSPFETPVKMKGLIKWVNDELQQKELHTLLIISIFIVIFLQIHPFQDGNGRLSRALTTLLLLQNGYSYVPYSSMEKVIEENKDQYYLALRRAQSTLEKNNSGLDEWIIFFLQCMQKQKMVLENKLKDEALLSNIPSLSLQIIELIKQRGSSSITDVVSITHANRNTVKLHLRKLVENGHLATTGTGRGVRYRLN